jgi:hypothetical protein
MVGIDVEMRFCSPHLRGWSLGTAGQFADPALLKQIKEVERGRVDAYAERRGSSARFVPGGRVWEVPADLALPSATQNELDENDAATLIRNGVKAVSEGANMPTTPEAVHLLQQAGVAFGPGKAANAGGVAVSALEMAQNHARTSWTAARVEEELTRIMNDIHTTCHETAARYDAPGDYVTGANIAAFELQLGPQPEHRSHLMNPGSVLPAMPGAAPVPGLESAWRWSPNPMFTFTAAFSYASEISGTENEEEAWGRFRKMLQPNKHDRTEVPFVLSEDIRFSVR